MHIVIRERPYDLFLIMGCSTALVLVILLVPDITALRVIFGLPFILFFPGYALISALYPERPRKMVEEEMGGKGTEEGREEEGFDGEEEARKKGLDHLERLALSLGLSIAITPLIGLILNYTYDWDPEHLGIRLVPILISQYAFIMVTSAVAVHRRSRVPAEDRYGIEFDLEVPRDHSTMDKVLTVGIVLMMVLSVGMLVYIIVVPREGEAFTEFYVLGKKGMADDYPRNFPVGENQSIFVGIGNHEHRDMNYTLVMMIEDSGVNITIDSLDHVVISRTEHPSMEVEVEDGSTWERPVNFSIGDIGLYKLRILLFRSGGVYRDLHLWVRAFNIGHLVRADPCEFFIAGKNGDPFLLPTLVDNGSEVSLSLGAVNGLEERLEINMTVHLGEPGGVGPMPVPPGAGTLHPENSLYLSFHLEGGSSSLVPFIITLPGGSWTLHFEVRWAGGRVEMTHDISVGGEG